MVSTNPKPALSLSQIGDQMGLTKTRVRQLREAPPSAASGLLMEAAKRKKNRAAAAKPK